MIENRFRLEMPLVRDIVKSAAREVGAAQTALDFEAKPTVKRVRRPAAMTQPLLANPKAREMRRGARQPRKSKVG